MPPDYYALTDRAVTELLGARLRALRLRQNRTQQSVAAAAGLSTRTYQALEEGRGKLENLVAVLRELQALESLDAFLPEPVASPLELAKRQGKSRRRASGRRIRRPEPNDDGGETW